jgi:hypothetical protein
MLQCGPVDTRVVTRECVPHVGLLCTHIRVAQFNPQQHFRQIAQATCGMRSAKQKLPLY